MEREIKEKLIQLNNDFSASKLTEILVESGLLTKEIVPEKVDFGRFIFLQSNVDEVYSSIERRFIENVSFFYRYPEYTKNVARGTMKCRVVCVDLSQIGNGIYDAVFFMKLMNKAVDGWLLYVIKLTNGIHIGMRIFNKDETDNCALCECDDTELVLEELKWSVDIKDFISYYAFLYDVIFPKDKNLSDYDEMARKRHGIQYDYLQGLREIEKNYNLSLAYEIDRYISWFEGKNEYSFYMQYQDAMEELKAIKSSKVNTLEMLFEADELEKITKENEQMYRQSLENPVEERGMDDEIVRAFKDDPEAMIKRLKEKRGIL